MKTCAQFNHGRHLPQNFHPARCWLKNSGDDFQSSAFPRAVSTNQPEYFSILYSKRHTTEGFEIPHSGITTEYLSKGFAQRIGPLANHAVALHYILEMDAEAHG